MATKKWVCWQVLPQSSLLIAHIDVYTNIHVRYQASSLKSNSPSDIRLVTCGVLARMLCRSLFCCPGLKAFVTSLPHQNPRKHMPVSSTLLLYLKDHVVGGIRNVRLHTSVFISPSLMAWARLSNNKPESQQVLDKDYPDVFLLAFV